MERNEIKDNGQLLYSLQAMSHMTGVVDLHRAKFGSVLKEQVPWLEKKVLNFFERAAVNGILPEELLPYFDQFLVIKAQWNLNRRDLPALRKDLDYLNAVFNGTPTNETGVIAHLIKRNKALTATVIWDRSLKKLDIRSVISRINSALGGN
jgi:hypothetical protein